ncbi:glycosyl transferase [Mariniradius saccharolyticus AK6]|uniref:Glycosyl transferase n=1 Tax=Mariniradius saccharolyticus AK6 TaxID=1239962 RepID=M7X841_9BACT|nr:glycosyltransferase family 4 protein [Mariniradius saccharolyticus]EMS30873.1 glycosyl transferase [Mariniradius saccharolyticus AK6]
MKILFVSSGNRKQGLNPIIRLQAESLEKVGVEIEHFLIFGSGFLGYLKNVFKLRTLLKTHPVHLIHAHFGFSCVVAQLAKGKIPLVVTLMGTDILGHKNEDGSISLRNKLVLWINHYFANHVYEKAIVMNQIMKDILSKRKNPTYILSNGVDTSLFYEVPKSEALQFLDWDPDVHHFVFISNPARPEKNFPLAEEAVKLLQERGYRVQLHAVFQEKSENLKYYYSAATALVLTSFHEGSPNVVKEAFCCNCPIVSTPVGDVSITTAGIEGCFIGPYDSVGFSAQLEKAIAFSTASGRIKGRQRIDEMGFDSQIVANRIKRIYEESIGEK